MSHNLLKITPENQVSCGLVWQRQKEIIRLSRSSLALAQATDAQRQQQLGNARPGALLARQAYLLDNATGGKFRNQVYEAFGRTASCNVDEVKIVQLYNRKNKKGRKIWLPNLFD